MQKLSDVLNSQKILPPAPPLMETLTNHLCYITVLLIPLLMTPSTDKAYSDAKLLALHVLGLSIGALTVSFLISGSLKQQLRNRKSVLFFALIIFYFFINVLSTLFSVNFIESFSLLKNLSAYFFIGSWVFFQATDEAFIRRLLSIIAIATGVVAIYGLLQYAGFDFIPLAMVRSPVSTLGNLNFVAQFYLGVLPLVCVALLLATRSLSRYFYLSIVVLSVIHLFLTHSRGGYVGFAVGLILFCVLYIRSRYGSFLSVIRRLVEPINRSRLIIIVSGVIIVFWTFVFLDRGETFRQISTIVYEQQESNRYRLLTWQSTLKMVKDYPLLGVGIGNFRFNFPRYKSSELWQMQDPWGKIRQIRTHNDYLNILAETGIFGFLSFVILVLFVLVNAFKSLSRNSKSPFFILQIAGITAIIATLTQSIFDFNLYNPHSALFFWIAMALVARLSFGNTNYPLTPRQPLICGRFFYPVLCAVLIAVFVINLTSYRYFVSSVYVRKATVSSLYGRNNDALNCYEKARTIFPHNIDCLAGEADLLRRTNQFLPAAAAYKRWLQKEPFMLPIYTRIGYCYVKLKDYNLAYDYFQVGLKLNPQSPVLLNNMANLLLLTKDYSRALKYFRRANKTPNSFSRANRLNFARVLLATGNDKEALNILRQLYHEQPTNPQVMQMLAQCEYRAGNLEQAKELYLRLYLLSPQKLKDKFLKQWQQINKNTKG
ncbi:O-antigen ligase family protein [Candidatus Sumerlaeota bacterium]|nr:O-antigen ligase family protein [Candidatus Sumerlaeota bacterium]